MSILRHHSPKLRFARLRRQNWSELGGETHYQVFTVVLVYMSVPSVLLVGPVPKGWFVNEVEVVKILESL